MPGPDLSQAVRAAVEKNIGIPAILDALSQFVDSPMSELEVSNLGEVFSSILENLNSRYPVVASQRAADTAKNEIITFLQLANKDAGRVRDALAHELPKANLVMTGSISERFSKAGMEERRAIDATLRLIRRSPFEIMFRAESANPVISKSGADFQKFFSAVRAESPSIRELRYQNLIVEKGLFNKLVLKSRNQDYIIWVPSFYAKENVDSLIEKTGVVSEHILESRLNELKQEGHLDNSKREFLDSLRQNLGVLPKGEEPPEELRDLFSLTVENYTALAPLELDDIFFFAEKESATKERLSQERQREEDEKALLEASKKRQAEEEKRRKNLFAMKSHEGAIASQEEKRERATGDVYLGKQLDFEQFVSEVPKLSSGAEISSRVKTVGEYYASIDTIKSHGVSIVGASGSGRSTTLRRMLDGLGASGSRIIVIDQKGEHRGIAWKYKWKVYAFVSDTQATSFRVPFLSENNKSNPEFLSDLISEWCLGSGVGFSSQERARLVAVLRSLGEGNLNSESISTALVKEPGLEQIGRKISKNLLSPAILSRIFSNTPYDIGEEGNVLFDISGKGLRDPTTKEERLILSALILKSIEEKDSTKDSIIVVEDMFDRIKSDGLRKTLVESISKLRGKGNSVVSTSRSQIRDYMDPNSLEIVHRLSGEKAISDEVSGLKLSQGVRALKEVIASLPRGYALTSETQGASRKSVKSAAVQIEPLQF